MDLEELIRFCAPRQEAYIRAIKEHGSATKAAAAMGVNTRTVERALQVVKQKAAKRGYSPYEDSMGRAPEGYHVHGKSTLYDEDGNVRAQWVKTHIDKDTQIQLLQEAMSEMAEEYKGVVKKVTPPKGTQDDLMMVIPMGDPHFGLYCWHEQTGEDFDLKIARGLMKSAIERLVKSAPKCKQGLLINLGDFFHSDLITGMTLRSNHHLHVDSRWAYVLRVGVASMKLAIAEMLKKCDEVTIINCIGNHDDHSSQFLSLILSEAYENEPRVHIDTAPVPYHYFRFGRVLVGSTHGHTVKPDKLPGLMAHDKPQDWGQTEFRHWYVGHFHSKSVWEFPGCTVEYCRTLAAKDDWTTASGYRSLRDMRCVIYHKDFGEFESYRVGVEQIG